MNKSILNCYDKWSLNMKEEKKQSLKVENVSKVLPFSPKLESGLDSVIDTKHNLIISVVKKGYAYKVVKVANENGASGAFIVNGRGTSKEKKSFFGFEVAPENEMVMMVVKQDMAYPIVKSIYAIADFKSHAKGIVFVLPIATLLD